MALECGFKKTEVGIIPVDWDVKCFADIAEIDPENLNSNTRKDYHFRYISLEDIDNGVLTGSIEMMFQNAPSRARRVVRRNDILVSTVRPNLLSHYIFRDKVSDTVCSTGFSVVRCKHYLAYPSYVYFHLFGYCVNQQISSLLTGSNYPAINATDVKNLKIPLPPLPEQRAIAAALSDVDALLASLDALIAKKRLIQQGAMQELLTGQRRLPGFSGEWKPYTFGEIFAFLSTANNPRSDLADNGEVEYVHYGDIHTRWKSFLDCSGTELPFIPAEKVRNIPLLENGDLVMADASEDYAGIGVSVEVKNVNGRKIVGGLHTLLLRGNKDIVADGFKGYLQYLPYVKDALIKIATGISVYGISKNNIKNISMHLPSPDEQRAIASILFDIEADIRTLEQQRDKTRQIKQGMMQELLTGRIRLNQD